MKRQSSLSSWISKTKKQKEVASLNDSDEYGNETESRLTNSYSDSIVARGVASKESDHDPWEYDRDESALTSTQNTVKVVTSSRLME